MSSNFCGANILRVAVWEGNSRFIIIIFANAYLAPTYLYAKQYIFARLYFRECRFTREIRENMKSREN